MLVRTVEDCTPSERVLCYFKKEREKNDLFWQILTVELTACVLLQ